jgi:hypothetical protein
MILQTWRKARRCSYGWLDAVVATLQSIAGLESLVGSIPFRTGAAMAHQVPQACHGLGPALIRLLMGDGDTDLDWGFTPDPLSHFPEPDDLVHVSRRTTLASPPDKGFSALPEMVAGRRRKVGQGGTCSDVAQPESKASHGVPKIGTNADF